ncbi:MAG: FHA domain-containing protein [Deltaproteobacteria bacterium]|nr:FHA domain-containing protein [Deltaproteobacteria bacterium]
MHKLIIEDDEGKTTVVPLIRDEISIGRKEGNTIRLTERNVSRRHAKLVKQNGAVFIEDLESYNGIKVNGNRIAGRVAVAEGDRIQIGDYVLGLKVGGLPVAAKSGAMGISGAMGNSGAMGANASGGGAASSPGAKASASQGAGAKGASAQAAAVKAAARVPVLSEDAPTAQIDVTGLPAADARSARDTANPARVVCVSSNFAGREFTLDKPVMVIGRTEDNDIVVNHRSISRHHARVVEDNGRYTIVDMQSANGVRVNGEEYGKVELRKADYIDLGHVRLRFVAHGEDFVFSRDATVVDPAQMTGGSRGGLWIALALVAVVAVGVLLWKVMGKSGPASDTPPKSSSGSGTTPAKGGSAKGDDQDELLRDLNRALEKQQWGQALTYCGRLTGADKENSQDNCARAEAEKKAKKLFDDATAAATRNEYKTAIETFSRIPKSSMFFAERERSANYLDAKRKYQAQALSEIDDLVRKKACAKAKITADELTRLLPEVSGVDAKLKSCSAVEAPPRVAVGPPKRPHRPVYKKPKKPKKPAGLTADEKAALKPLGKQAQNAYMANNSARARVLGKKYLRAFPHDQRVLSIVGMSACKLKKEAEAKRVYRRLKQGYRSLLKQVCSKAGIQLGL